MSWQNVLISISPLRRLVAPVKVTRDQSDQHPGPGHGDGQYTRWQLSRRERVEQSGHFTYNTIIHDSKWLTTCPFFCKCHKYNNKLIATCLSFRFVYHYCRIDLTTSKCIFIDNKWIIWVTSVISDHPRENQQKDKMYYLMKFPNGYTKSKKDQDVSAQPIPKSVFIAFFGFHFLFLWL